MKRILLVTAFIIGTTSIASAHGHHYHHYRTFAHGLGHGLGHMLDSMGRPHAWCGWYMRQLKGVADASYNLARNWEHYGSPTSPHPGAVVVWPHHVGLIEGSCDRGYLVHSGNYGNRVATVCMSVAGAIAFRE